MINRARRSDHFVATVMIGKDQSFRAYHFPRAASAKNDDRIFKRRFVNTVKLLLRQFQSLFYHVVVHLLPKQQGQPHPFICKGFEEKDEQENNCDE